MKKNWCISVLTMLLYLSGMTKAQNLLTNGSFDSDINGWISRNATTAEWVSNDGAPISGNGSIRITGTINNNGTYGMESDPIMVVEGYVYLTAGSVKTPAISVSERGIIQLNWYDAMDNQIQFDSVGTDFGIEDDVWVDVDDYFQAPDSADYVIIKLALQTGEPGQMDHPFGLWDDAVFMSETIFLNGFD